MDQFRGPFLPCTRLASDQDVGVDSRNLGDISAHPLHGSAAAHQQIRRTRSRSPLAEKRRFDFAEAAIDALLQLRYFERLAKIIRRARAKSGHCGGFRFAVRNRNDGKIRMCVADSPDPRELRIRVIASHRKEG